jgi:hypothetical protein
MATNATTSSAQRSGNSSDDCCDYRMNESENGKKRWKATEEEAMRRHQETNTTLV